MDNMFSLTGHAGYVLSAYAVTFVVLGGLVAVTLRQLQAARRAEALLVRARRPRR